MVVDVALWVSGAVFAFALSATPGPNNTVLLALSSTRGARASVDYLVGMALGLSALVLAITAGLGAIFVAYPLSYRVLTYVGFAYVLYLAWGIIKAAAPQSPDSPVLSHSVWKALLFQWVNPKAWIVIATYATAYLPAERGIVLSVVGSLVFVAATMPGAVLWVGLGHWVSRVLTSPRNRKLFTGVMAFVLVASMVPVLFLA